MGLTILLLGLVLGCNRQVVQQKQPPDPLLVSKMPVEGRPTARKIDATARVEPPPPYPGGEIATTSVQRDLPPHVQTGWQPEQSR
jgi:hypothetical protein